MNTKNMKRLIAHLRKVPRRGFDMKWVVRPVDHDWNQPDCCAEQLQALRRAAKKNYTCGMAACVGGHLAMIFRKPPERYWRTFVRETLDLCEDHTKSLTDEDAPPPDPQSRRPLPGEAAAREAGVLRDET